MEKSLAAAHVLGLPTSSFTRVEKFRDSSVRNAQKHQFLQLRCTAVDQDDDWEGSIRVSDEWQPHRQSLRRDTLSTNSLPTPVERNSRPSPRRSSNQRLAASYGAGKGDSISEEDEGGNSFTVNAASNVTGKSRGEIFLERALGARDLITSGETEVARELVVKSKKERKKKREKLAAFVSRRDEPCCYGCGAVLQSSTAEAPGFLSLDIFEVKKKHHQLGTVLCGRCQLLSQGAMIPAVSGNGGYGEGKGFVSSDELRAQLTHLRYEKALIVKLVDIVDFNGSFLTRVRDLVGSNPIILVVTKVDLLPKGTDLAAVGDWVIQATIAKKLNVISVHLTSAKAATGISGFSALMLRQRQGRDVYVLGSANVGKSAFISTLLRDMGERDPIAAAAQRFRPIQSAMPGTTLGPIQIDAFSGGGSLYDTPGVHLHHRLAAAVSPEDLPLLAPRKRLAGRLISAPDPSLSLVGQSIFWGGVVRIDVLEAPENIALTFYGPNSIPVLGTLTPQAEVFYEVFKLHSPTFFQALN
uniref:CP-type G domain-containing protein n=1 Tax=Physcomitrium patens TaxID=3218 RepID=A0A7I4E6M4_PHYPA